MNNYEYRIESVKKAFELIDLMASNNGELNIKQIAEEMDTSSSSINRFLITLQETGYINKCFDNNRYFLSNKFFLLANKILSQHPLIRKYYKLAHYTALKYDVTVNINSIFKNNPFLLYKIERFYSKDVDFIIGDTIPAYCCSTGKMIMTSYKEDELKDYFKNLTIIKYQKNTLTSKEEILNEIKKAKINGFAIHNEEYVAGIFCISFPLYINKTLTGTLTLLTDIKNKTKIYNTDVIKEIKIKINEIK